MRRNVLWLILVVVTATLEATWLIPFRLQGVLPDLVLLIVVYFAIEAGQERAMFTGALGGLLQDVLGDAALGHHVLCLVVLGYCLGALSQRLVTQHPAVKAALVFVASLSTGLLFTAIAYIQDPNLDAVYTVTTSVVPRAFYTAVVTPVVFFILHRAWYLAEAFPRTANERV